MFIILIYANNDAIRLQINEDGFCFTFVHIILYYISIKFFKSIGFITRWVYVCSAFKLNFIDYCYQEGNNLIQSGFKIYKKKRRE